MVYTLAFLVYSLLGLGFTYVIKIMSFVKLTAVCRQENIGVENFMYNSSDLVISQADKMLKHADRFEGFKVLSYLSAIGLLLSSIATILNI